MQNPYLNTRLAKKAAILLAAVGTAATLGGCVQDDYDLSDVDTTARLTVNDLQIPVNIDNISLRSVIDISEGGRIKEIDGEYAVSEEGEFSSGDILISAVHMAAPTLAPVETALRLTTDAPAVPAARAVTLQYPIVSESVQFSYSAPNVSPDILEIQSFATNFSIIATLSVGGLPQGVTFGFENVTFQLPAGLTTTLEGYDPSNGRLTLPSLQSTAGGSVSVTVPVSRINYPIAGGTLADQTARVEGELALLGGSVRLDAASLSGVTPPELLSLTVAYVMSDIDINEFTGRVQHPITNVHINPVDLSGLPDFLRQPGTDLRLADPRIELTVNNPLSANHLGARSGLTITSVASDGVTTPHSLDAGGTFAISPLPVSRLVFAPNDKGNLPADASFVPFAALSDVLAGNGIPSRLDISLDRPEVFPQQVDNLPLGRPLGAVTGRYNFFAPLALLPGSNIVYSDTVNGWNGPDVDKIVIEKLTVTASVTNNLPLAATLTGYPINVQGQQINGVEILPTPSTIPAGATTDVSITITGEVRHLDGIIFTAVAASESDTPLRPDLTIDLAGVRARATGYFEKEL